MNYHLLELKKSIEYARRSAQLRIQTVNLSTHVALIRAQIDYLNSRGNITPEEHLEIDAAYQYAEAEKTRLQKEAEELTQEMLMHIK